MLRRPSIPFLPDRAASLPELALALALAAGSGAPRSARADVPSPTAHAQAAASEPGWATAQAAELTRQGAAAAARAEVDLASLRYLEAIGFDATYGPAYLGLGALREQQGDARGAEDAYSRGVDRIVGFADGLRARGALRLRQRRAAEAVGDLAAASALRPDDAALAEELAQGYLAAGAFPAALATTRRAAALHAARGDAARHAEAQRRARALSILVGEADPVRAGAGGRGPVRNALARFAR